MNAILSIDASLREKWQNGLQAVVHSVYSGAIYIQDRAGHLFCLTTSEESNGPEVARLDTACFNRLLRQLRAGDAFSSSQHHMYIGKAKFSFEKSIVWNAPLPDYPSTDRLRFSLSKVKQILAECGHEGGLKNFFQQSVKQDIMSAALCQRAENLLTALQRRQFSDVATCGFSLLGLGYGLSPSGDDFLAALVTVFHMPQGPFPDECCQIGRAWAGAAEDATTSVGAFLLRVAAQGRAREPICNFLTSLSTGDDTLIRDAARLVMQFGSSSGTDWLVGLIVGLEAGVGS